MLKKRISILIVPYPKGKALRVSIPVGAIIFPAAFLAVFILLDVLFSVNCLKKFYDARKIAEISKQNAHFESKFFDVQALALQLKSDLALILEHEKKIMRLLGLADRSKRMSKSEQTSATLTPVVTTNSTYGVLSHIPPDVDQMLFIAQKQNQALTQIYRSFELRKERLDHTPSFLPAPGYLSRGFGIKIDPFTGLAQPHTGVDLACGYGTPVRAAASGRVAFAGWRSGLGKTIIINHGRELETYYGHLSRIKVIPGQPVSKGALIGAVGSTGYSTGPHLHYEVHLHKLPQNPLRYVLSEK